MQYGSFITFVSDEYVRFDKTVLEVENLRVVLDRTIVEQLINFFFLMTMSSIFFSSASVLFCYFQLKNFGRIFIS